MSKKYSLVLAIAAVLVGGGLALADHHRHMDPAKKAEMLKQFDTNSDGKLDSTERAAMRARRIAQFDTDKDGTLSPTERAAMRDQKLTSMFQELDTNHDGKLTLDEFKAGKLLGRGHGRGGLLKKP